MRSPNRLVIALLVLLPIIALSGRPLPQARGDWLLIGVTGVLLLGLNYAFLYWGAQYVTSGLSAVLQGATPVFGLLFARALLDRERVSARQVSGLLLGMLGVAVIFADQLSLTGPDALGPTGRLTATRRAASSDPLSGAPRPRRRARRSGTARRSPRA